MARLPSSLEGMISIGGAALSYRIAGSGSPAMVLGSAVYYPRTFSSMFESICRAAYCDLRHFAAGDGSLQEATVDLDTYLDDIERLRGAIGLERCALIGHSHHGNLALEYAKRHPDRLSHLVLIGTPPCGVQQTIDEGERYWREQASEARKAALARNRASLQPADRGRLGPEEAFVAQYVADGPKYWNDFAYDARPLWRDVPLNMGALRAFKGFFVDYEFSWDPTQLKAPVLVVMGRHDFAVPHTLWNAVLPRLENVTYRLLENCGHTPQLEEPAAFDGILLEWLAQSGRH